MWYDAFVLGILAFMTLRGAAKGAVWQLASLISLLLAFTLAKSGSVIIAPVIPLAAPMNRWVAMILLYLVCSWVCFSFARKIKRRMEKTSFTEYDRHLGGVLGFSYGVTICLVITFFAVTLSQTSRKHVLEARSGIAAAWLMDQLDPVMPTGLNNLLAPYLENLDPSKVQEKEPEEEKETVEVEQTDPELLPVPQSNTSKILELLNSGEAPADQENVVPRGSENTALQFLKEEPETVRIPRWKVQVDPANSWTSPVITWNLSALQTLNRDLVGTPPAPKLQGNIETHLENGLLTGWVLPGDGVLEPALIYELPANSGEFRYVRCSGQGCLIGVPRLIPVASPWLVEENLQLQCTAHPMGALEERTRLLSESVLSGKQTEGFHITLAAEPDQPAEFLLDYILLDRHETIGVAEFDHPETARCWNSEGLLRPKVWNSSLTSRAMTPNATLQRDDLQIDARRFQHLELRLKLPRGSNAKLFWATDTNGWANTHELTLPAAKDHGYHIYRIDLRDVPEWSGIVQGVRLMPVSKAGQSFAIDYIRAIAVDDSSGL